KPVVLGAFERLPNPFGFHITHSTRLTHHEEHSPAEPPPNRTVGKTPSYISPVAGERREGARVRNLRKPGKFSTIVARRSQRVRIFMLFKHRVLRVLRTTMFESFLHLRKSRGQSCEFLCACVTRGQQRRNNVSTFFSDE